MEKLKELMSLCKASVDIYINEHKGYYESVEEHFRDKNEEVEPEIMAEMIKRDTVICIQAYPNTPVSFFFVFHYDIETAIDLALAEAKECRNEWSKYEKNKGAS